MKTQKFIAFGCLSTHASILFAYICRLQPEKALFLILIRIAVTVALFFIWKYAEEIQTKQLFAFITIGSLIGLAVGYWDELPTMFNAYPFEFLLALSTITLLAIGGFTHVALKTNTTKES